jgi:hypothetical protein
MSAKLKDAKIVRKTIADISAPSAPDLARLRKAMAGPVDTSEIAARQIPPQYPLVRDARGQVPKKRPNLIRDAILAELGRRKMTRYELWKRANQHCARLPNSAVYEFLLGRRAISVDYCDAMLRALGLGVAPLRESA